MLLLVLLLLRLTMATQFTTLHVNPRRTTAHNETHNLATVSRERAHAAPRSDQQTNKHDDDDDDDDVHDDAQREHGKRDATLEANRRWGPPVCAVRLPRRRLYRLTKCAAWSGMECRSGVVPEEDGRPCRQSASRPGGGRWAAPGAPTADRHSQRADRGVVGRRLRRRRRRRRRRQGRAAHNAAITSGRHEGILKAKVDRRKARRRRQRGPKRAIDK